MPGEPSSSVDARVAVPDVRAERCVHSITEQASCRACVDACPTAAWVIDNEMLGIDATRCDGCDLCVPACPEAAIVQRFRPEVRKTPHGSVAAACCERAPVEGQDVPRMPCLHGIGISDLLRLARDRVQHLVTTTGDCKHCPRGNGERLEHRLQSVNGLLADRGLPTIAHRSSEAARWLETWRRVNALARQSRISRRGFFRTAVEEPGKRIEAVLERAQGRFIPPGSLLPLGSPGDRAPFVPRIDPGQCSGCDACVRLCPHDAIRVESEDKLPRAYVIAADRCSGCGICTDLCEQDAVAVLHWRPIAQVRLPLANRRCRACGVTYHLPQTDELRSAENDLCPICSGTDHHRNLYQLLD